MNSKHTIARYSILVVIAVALSARLSNAQQFAAVDFPGASSTHAYGINNSGQMVGVFTDVGNVTHGFLLSSGIFSTIDYPGAALTVAAGINNAGEIVGQYNDISGVQHGFT